MTSEQIDLLRRWIDEGATYAKHWSFENPQQSKPPVVEQGEVRNPIDQFILAKLAKEGLEVSRAADRRTLLRRLSFDLTGLPPTRKEVEQFVADPTGICL